MTSIAPKQVGLVGVVANAVAGGVATFTGATNIEQLRLIDFNQTTAGQTFTLPAPADTSVQFVLDVVNTGTASFSLYGMTVGAGTGAMVAWSGTMWVVTPPASAANVETATITALNTVANLAGTPNTAKPISWFLNGARINSGISVAGKAVTFTAATVGYNLQTSDELVVEYYL